MPFAAWSRHPAPFDVWTLERALRLSELPAGGLLVDPFAGTGSAGALACARGDRFFGVEAHPYTALIGQLKFERPADPDRLESAADAAIETAKSTLATTSTEDEHPLLQRTLPLETLRALVAVRGALEAAPADSTPWASHLSVALNGALRELAGSRWPRSTSQRALVFDAPFELLRTRVSRMANDLRLAPRRPEGTVVQDDARKPSAWRLRTGSADASVTSPPYFNQVAYAEWQRLELYFTGAVGTWAELRGTGASLMRSCVQDITSAASASAWTRISAYPAVCGRLEGLAAELRAAAGDREQPKRYDDLLPAYFADIADVLHHLHSALRPGARSVWAIGESAPYGISLDIPTLTAELAVAMGFEWVEERLLRLRGNKWRGLRNRHSRSLAERLIVLRRRNVAQEQTTLPGLG